MNIKEIKIKLTMDRPNAAFGAHCIIKDQNNETSSAIVEVIVVIVSIPLISRKKRNIRPLEDDK